MRGSVLSRKLRVLRAEQGLTIGDASKEAGVSADTLGLIERGKRAPQVSTLRKLGDLYGVSLDELLQAADEREPALPLDEAPQDPGRPETDPPPAEEEPIIVPQSADTLKEIVDGIKRRKRNRESQLERIREGELDYDDVVEMELANKALRTFLSEKGFLEFAKAVVEGRELAEIGKNKAQPLCQALLRELRYLEDLTDEARTEAILRSSEIREEIEKDSYLWQLRGAESLVSENVASSDRAG